MPNWVMTSVPAKVSATSRWLIWVDGYVPVMKAISRKTSSTFWQLKNYVTYSGNIGDKHHYTAMVGQECWESSYDFTSVFNSGLPSDEVHNPALGTGNPDLSMQVLEARLWHLSLHV